MEERETITITREQFEQAARVAEALRSSRDFASASALSGGLSFNPHPFHKYMRPEVARKLRELGQDPKAIQGRYLSGKDALAVFAQPDTTEVHVDAILTQVMVGWSNMAYIGRQVFPNIQVTKPSDKYFKFAMGEWMTDDAKVRAAGARAAGGGYTVSTDNYSCDNWAREHQVPDAVQQAADAPLDPMADGARFVSERIDMRVERLVAAEVFGANKWTGNITLSGNTQWSSSSSTPFTAMKTARLAILGAAGLLPNTLVLGQETFEALALHADLLDRVKYGGTGDRPAMITAGMMAQLFMVDRVLVGASQYNSAYEGATASLSSVWGKLAWLGYVAPTPTRTTPSAGYVFTMGQQTDTYREDQTSSDYVRGQEELDVKVVSADCGYLFTDAVA